MSYRQSAVSPDEKNMYKIIYSYEGLNAGQSEVIPKFEFITIQMSFCRARLFGTYTLPPLLTFLTYHSSKHASAKPYGISLHVM
ncbi:unnamed protein product [Callosobruchus maculatus]|uniref:Uncharacterized protein n=1 Tax=Callosobruchus maculatus TaxID=64391 RepID=A0A653CR72_CALMS|nr:unnamed protein product [Callosobruchus maculatus]